MSIAYYARYNYFGKNCNFARSTFNYDVRDGMNGRRLEENRDINRLGQKECTNIIYYI